MNPLEPQSRCEVPGRGSGDPKEQRVDAHPLTANDVKARFIMDEVRRLNSAYDEVWRKVEQLTFESSRSMQRVYRRGSAATPVTPSANHRLKFMALSPFIALLLIVPIFLLLDRRGNAAVTWSRRGVRGP